MPAGSRSGCRFSLDLAYGHERPSERIPGLTPARNGMALWRGTRIRLPPAKREQLNIVAADAPALADEMPPVLAINKEPGACSCLEPKRGRRPTSCSALSPSLGSR